MLLLGDSMGATGALLAAGAVAEACSAEEKHVGSFSQLLFFFSFFDFLSFLFRFRSSFPSPARPGLLPSGRSGRVVDQAGGVGGVDGAAERADACFGLRRDGRAPPPPRQRPRQQRQGKEGEQHKERGPPPPPPLSTPSPPAPMRVDVHVGSWRHDLAQALPLQSEAGAAVKVWAVPSHRLAAALDSRGELEPLVRSALLSVMGFSDGRGVRISNVL